MWAVHLGALGAEWPAYPVHDLEELEKGLPLGSLVVSGEVRIDIAPAPRVLGLYDLAGGRLRARQHQHPQAPILEGLHSCKDASSDLY